MLPNYNEKSLLGLSMHPPPGLPQPPGLYQSHSLVYQEPIQSSYNFHLDDISMIDNELVRITARRDDLLNKRQEIDTYLNDIETRINFLIKKKTAIKNVQSISSQRMLMSGGGGGGSNIHTYLPEYPPRGYPSAYKQIHYPQPPQPTSPIVESVPKKEIIAKPSDSFIVSVTKILTENPNLKANQIQHKLPDEDKPQPQSRIFQKLLMQVPNIQVREEKVIRSNGVEENERIFYLDHSKFIPSPVKTGRNWKRECFKKMKGKPCKLNEKGLCNYCQ